MHANIVNVLSHSKSGIITLSTTSNTKRVFQKQSIKKRQLLKLSKNPFINLAFAFIIGIIFLGKSQCLFTPN